MKTYLISVHESNPFACASLLNERVGDAVTIDGVPHRITGYHSTEWVNGGMIAVAEVEPVLVEAKLEIVAEVMEVIEADEWPLARAVAANEDARFAPSERVRNWVNAQHTRISRRYHRGGDTLLNRGTTLTPKGRKAVAAIQAMEIGGAA